MKLSIVATLYRSESTVDEFCERALAIGAAQFEDVELILVNDDSPDGSLERALAWHTRDPRVAVVDLARHCGHHKAMMTGLRYARGGRVFLLDSDLEEEPEWLAGFQARLAVGDCDVVYGFQERRRGSLSQRVTGDLFFRLANILGEVKLHPNTVTARLMDRNYVNALVRHRDREFMIGQLYELVGFRQVGVPVKKLSRSKTTYSLYQRFEIALKYLTTTSTRLLYAVLGAGLAVCGVSGVLIVYMLVRYLRGDVGVIGWTSVVVSVWFFGGLSLLVLGIQSIYIANLLSESKRRPYTIVRRVYRHREPDASLALSAARVATPRP